MGNVVKNIPKQDFGTLCICALRYCQGRETYMPDLVRGIVRKYLKDISDKDLKVMVEDCNFQRKTQRYGDPSNDKPGWLMWEAEITEEAKKRKLIN